MGAVNLVWAGSMMFSASILSLSHFSKFLVSGPVWYGFECTGAVSD